MAIFNTELIKKNFSPEDNFDKQVLSEKIYKLLKANNSFSEKVLLSFNGLRNQIAVDCRLDNIIFLFGNGSSIYAGTKSTIHSKLLENYIQTASNNCLKELLKKIESSSNNNFEKCINNLIICKHFYELIKDDANEKEINNILEQLKTNLINDCVNNLKYSDLHSHEILFLKLRNMNLLNKVNIFTTNYDLAFEYVLDKLNIKYANGFTGFINRKFDIRSLILSDKVKLYKVHGSIDWKYIEDDIYELQPKFNDGKMIIDDNTNKAIIYPSSRKLEETFNIPFSELIRSMLDVLESKRNLVFVIGYKYGDTHINDVLLKSIINQNNVYYFFNYDEDKNDFLEKIIELSYSLDNINILSGKIFCDFQVFADFIFPATASKNDDEFVKEKLREVLGINGK